jgi:hypothetical protein
MGYQIAIGENNEAGLTEVAVQPHGTTPEPGRRQRGGDGLIQRDGHLVQEWRFGFATKAQYTAFLAAAGLSTAESAKVTVNTTDRERDFGHWNAIISRPSPEPEFYSRHLEHAFELILKEAL